MMNKKKATKKRPTIAELQRQLWRAKSQATRWKNKASRILTERLDLEDEYDKEIARIRGVHERAIQAGQDHYNGRIQHLSGTVAMWERKYGALLEQVSPTVAELVKVRHAPNELNEAFERGRKIGRIQGLKEIEIEWFERGRAAAFAECGGVRRDPRDSAVLAEKKLQMERMNNEH